MSRPNPPRPPDTDDRLAQACATHLAREQTLLESARKSLLDARAAFVRGDLDTLQTLLRGQDDFLRATADLGEAREQLRRGLARHLRLPASEVTLRRAASLLSGPAGQRLAGERDRLWHLAREVEHLNRQNAALLHSSVALLQGVFGELTGRGAGDRYGPRGQRREAVCGSLLQARG